MWTPTPTAPYSARRHSTPWSGSGRPSGSPAAPASCRHHPVAGHRWVGSSSPLIIFLGVVSFNLEILVPLHGNGMKTDVPDGVGRGACAGHHRRLRRARRRGHRSGIKVHPPRRIHAVPEERWAEREEDRRPNELFLFQGFGEKQMRVYKQHLATMRLSSYFKSP